MPSHDRPARLLTVKRRVAHEALQLVLAALAIVDVPQRFSRRAYALDSRGRNVRVDDQRAVRFCLAGSVLRAEHEQFGTEMPIATSEEVDRDDLFEPVLPPTAPLRMRVALQALALAARAELEELGMQFTVVAEDDEPKRDRRQLPSTLHAPLLLGLHPNGGHARCRAATSTAAVALGRLASDDEMLNQVLPDKAVRDEASGAAASEEGE